MADAESVYLRLFVSVCVHTAVTGCNCESPHLYFWLQQNFLGAPTVCSGGYLCPSAFVSEGLRAVGVCGGAFGTRLHAS